MRGTLCFTLAFMIGAAAPAWAVDVLVNVQGQGTAPVNGTVVAHSADAERPAVEFAIRDGIAHDAPLPTGEWRLLLRAPGVFHIEQATIIERGIKSITLQAWQSGSITGVVALPDGKRKPDSLRITFWPADGAPKQAIPPQADIVSAVDKTSGRFEANLPAGTLDVRVRAKGHVSHYRFALELQPGAKVDLGALRFKPGASVVGYVGVGSEVKVRALSEILIRLAPAMMDSAPTTTDRRRAGAVALAVNPNAHGFFHFEGVAPGEYLIQAVDGKNISNAISIIVVPEAEAFVNDRLVLEKPRTVTVHVSPPTAPKLQQWTAVLWRNVNGRFEEPREVKARDGVLRIADLVPGTYSVSIGPSPEDAWLSREIVVSSLDQDIVVDIPFAPVIGSVRIGQRPLAGARVVFGGETGVIHSTFIADDEGHFSGFLPEDHDSWSVSVNSSDPQVRRTVDEVRLLQDEGTRRADIVLPRSTLSGTVKDENGKAVSGAIVTVEHPGAQRGERMQTRSDPAGAFELTGLPAGEYQAQAQGAIHSAGGQPVFGESRLIPVSIANDGAASTEIELTLRAGARYFGRVVSPIAPIIGARVFALPTNVNRLVSVGTISGADGSFAQELPAETTDVDVLIAPPGFALRLFHARVIPAPVDVPVDQRAGTLIIETPKLSNDDVTDTFLRHAGAAYHLLPIATSWGRGNISRVADDRYRVTLPMMEPGDYTVCIGTEADLPAIRSALYGGACKTGFLAAMGELRLSIAEGSAKDSR